MVDLWNLLMESGRVGEWGVGWGGVGCGDGVWCGNVCVCDVICVWGTCVVVCEKQDTKFLTRLEEEDGDLSEVKVDKAAGLVGDVGAKVAADDAVPRGVVLPVKLLLDVGSNVLLNVVLVKGGHRAIHSVLLHVLRHVSVLDNSLLARHSTSHNVSPCGVGEGEGRMGKKMVACVWRGCGEDGGKVEESGGRKGGGRVEEGWRKESWRRESWRKEEGRGRVVGRWKGGRWTKVLQGTVFFVSCSTGLSTSVCQAKHTQEERKEREKREEKRVYRVGGRRGA